MKKVKLITQSSFLFLALLLATNSYSQTIMPNLGDDINICSGSTDSFSVTIENLDSLSGGTAPYTYMWLLLDGGEYNILEQGTVSSLEKLEDYTLHVSNIKSTTTLRLLITGAIDETEDYSIYLYGDKQIIVNKPTLSYNYVTACENHLIYIKAIACDLASSSPYTYTYLYNDPTDTLTYDSIIPTTTEWTSADSALLILPDYTEDILDKEINVRVLVKDANDNIQESENLKIKVLNLGQPALPVFQYICSDTTTLHLQLDGMNEEGLDIAWYRYYADGDSLVRIPDSVSSTMIVNQAGFYQAFVSKIDTVNEVYCTKTSGRVKVINLSGLDPSILSDDNYLDNPDDSIEIYFTYAFDSLTIDLLHVQWYKNNTEIEGATGLTYWAKEEGTYKAVLLDMCSAETNSNEIMVFQNATNVKEKMAKNGFDVYPNPTNGAFTLTCRNSNIANEDVSIRITDVFGKQVYERNGKISEKLIIDLSEKSDGVYFANISFTFKAEANSTFKILKTK